MDFLIHMGLLLLTLLIIVPACTGGDVAVRRGGIFRGLVAMFFVGLMNYGLWFVFTLATVGVVIPLHYLTFGLIGLLINALAFKLTGKLLPEVLYVRSYGAAVIAALVMTCASYFITRI